MAIRDLRTPTSCGSCAGPASPDLSTNHCVRVRRPGHSACQERSASHPNCKCGCLPRGQVNYSRTSSARTSSAAGISMPSAFAVLRLIAQGAASSLKRILAIVLSRPSSSGCCQRAIHLDLHMSRGSALQQDEPRFRSCRVTRTGRNRRPRRPGLSPLGRLEHSLRPTRSQSP
jgi:hypothetical protein